MGFHNRLSQLEISHYRALGVNLEDVYNTLVIVNVNHSTHGTSKVDEVISLEDMVDNILSSEELVRGNLATTGDVWSLPEIQQLLPLRLEGESFIPIDEELVRETLTNLLEEENELSFTWTVEEDEDLITREYVIRDGEFVFLEEYSKKRDDEEKDSFMDTRECYEEVRELLELKHINFYGMFVKLVQYHCVQRDNKVLAFL